MWFLKMHLIALIGLLFGAAFAQETSDSGLKEAWKHYKMDVQADLVPALI